MSTLTKPNLEWVVYELTEELEPSKLYKNCETRHSARIWKKYYQDIYPGRKYAIYRRRILEEKVR